jgi:hypothetical protein
VAFPTLRPLQHCRGFNECVKRYPEGRGAGRIAGEAAENDGPKIVRARPGTGRSESVVGAVVEEAENGLVEHFAGRRRWMKGLLAGVEGQPSSGLVQRNPLHRAKSRSAEQTVAPCSIATAAR